MRHRILACVRDHTTTWMRPPRVEEFCGCDIGSASLVEEEVGRYGCSSQINARARSASSCIFQDEGQCQHKITCIAVPLLLLLPLALLRRQSSLFHLDCIQYFIWNNITKRAHRTSLAHHASQPEHAPIECSQPAFGPQILQAHANPFSVPSLPRPTRSRVVPSSRLVCTYIYKATECELAPLMSQISNVHPATLS
jgi:hypothetical protein